MERLPLVSVCMPAYNHEKFVGEAIESILGQTAGDLELLVCDDQSSDGTFDVINSFGHDERLHVARMPFRSGPSVTLNEALRRARGKYIAFCASDDRWLPEKLERQIAFLEQHPEKCAVFCRPWLIDEFGERASDKLHLLSNAIGAESFGRTDWFAGFFFRGNCLCASSPLLRADAVRRTGEFDPLLLQLQDFDYWLRLLAHSDLALTQDRLMEYRVDSGGVNLSRPSVTASARSWFEASRVMRHFTTDAAIAALALVRVDGPDPFSWRPPVPDQNLMLANLALRQAQSAYAPAHVLFALDCLHRYAANSPSLIGHADEMRLFSLALFEVTGSQIVQDVFLGATQRGMKPAPELASTLSEPTIRKGLWGAVLQKMGLQ